MIYLTLDTDMWLNSLKESSEEENYIDRLTASAKKGEVKFLIPEIIIPEWQRNRENKRNTLRKDWNDFFKTAKKVFSVETIREIRTPEYLDQLVEEQLSKIDNLLENHAILLPITDEFKLKAVKMAEEKRAPFGSKNSIGDAYIYISIVDYVEKNSSVEAVFITNNHRDFSHKKNKDRIHPDLEDNFSRLGIQYYTEIKRFFHDYKDRISNDLTYINQYNPHLSWALNNPKTITALDASEDSYNENINFIASILEKSKLTKAQVISVFGLMKEDNSYREFFFRHVKHPVWFKVMESEGMFESKGNPVPVKTEEGFTVPFWESLNYLLKISEYIKTGDSQDLAVDIVEIIKNVSLNPIDNDHTWYYFIKILANLPNEIISTEILEFIPVWLSGKFDTSSLSSEICQKLLPKFLENSPSQKDIEKAEIILTNLLAIEEGKIRKTDFHGKEIEKIVYLSKRGIRPLVTVFTEKKFVEKILLHCSEKILYLIAKNLKELHFHFPNGLPGDIVTTSDKLKINASVEGKGLMLRIQNLEGVIIKESLLSNFESYNQEQTKDKLLSIIDDTQIHFDSSEENEKSINTIAYFITNGSYLSVIDKSIKKLQKKFRRNGKIEDAFALILRDYLDSAVKQEHKNAIKYLELFATSDTYRLPIFRRIALYVISVNWKLTKSLFWQIINSLFFDDRCKNELYQLLDKNSLDFDETELLKLDSLINVGADLEDTAEEKEYWKLRWYSALKQTKLFKSKFTETSKELEIKDDHFENSGEMNIKWSSPGSPLSAGDLAKMSNEEIVNFILEFKPEGSWGNATISGFVNEINKDVVSNPRKYATQIEFYQGLPYIYIYHILNGLKESWKNKIDFDWEKVLIFCYAYVKDERFYSEGFTIKNDSWDANSDWVVGSISSLLSQGMKLDENAFDLFLLPQAKKIIILLSKKLQAKNSFEEMNMDYPSYSLNSVSGKVLRSALDYSLRRARNLIADDKNEKWESELIAVFDAAIKEKMLDSFILVGWHFRQFLFLDKEWTIQQVKQVFENEDKNRIALIGGFLFENPPHDKEIYLLFYAYYELLIKDDIRIKNHHDNGLVRHIASHYFWRFESLEKGLVRQLLDSNNIPLIKELIDFVSLQRNYLNGAPTEEEEKFFEVIYDLWEFFIQKYDKPQNKEEEDILASLAQFIELFPELNSKNTALILKSGDISDTNVSIHHLIGKLEELTKTKHQEDTAKYLAQILQLIKPNSQRYSYFEKDKFIELIKFLYENKQKEIADKICDAYSKNGEYFLRDLYNEFN